MIGARLRRDVAARAGGVCEYCLIDEADTVFGCQVDHIISLKHDGPTSADNLALACMTCNRAKGSDVGSVLVPGVPATFVRFYHPRRDLWAAHFKFSADGVEIVGKTDIGAATARILAFNVPERLLERAALRAAGRYPSAEALRTLSRTEPLR